MSKILCFGELLLRFSPEMDGKSIDGAAVPVFIGGAELNVASALANWSLPSRYCTALPKNYFVEKLIEEIKHRGIDTSAIIHSGERFGIYYLPQGTDIKNHAVIYDRAHSSFSELEPGMLDWEAIMNEVSWFHFSAINPALNEKVAAVCEEAINTATSKGITISIDLNYRAKLWQYGKDPTSIMPGLVNKCQVVMGNLWAVEKLLGISSTVSDSTGKKHHELIEAADRSMETFLDRFQHTKTLAYTFRLDDEYFAVLNLRGERSVSKTFSLVGVTDRIGSGDCFMAALIYGLYQEHPPTDIINFAAAAAVTKLHERGDATRQSIEQIKSMI